VCVCVRERERGVIDNQEKERGREGERGRETERDRGLLAINKRETVKEMEKGRERERDRDRERAFPVARSSHCPPRDRLRR